MTDENSMRQRSKIPAAYEGLLSFFNHTELGHVNRLAVDAGVDRVPFTNVETLPPDNGERFFSQYLLWMREHKPTFDDNDNCLCDSCAGILSDQNRDGNSVKASQNERVTAQNGRLTVVPTCTPTKTPTAETNHNNTAKLASAAPGATTAHAASMQRPVQENRVEVAAQHVVNHRVNNTPVNQVHTPPIFWSSFVPSISTPMPPPWMYPAVMPFAAALRVPQYCCNRYMQWHNADSRRGRPPHDHHCRRISNKRRVEAEKNEMEKPPRKRHC